MLKPLAILAALSAGPALAQSSPELTFGYGSIATFDVEPFRQTQIFGAAEASVGNAFAFGRVFSLENNSDRKFYFRVLNYGAAYRINDTFAVGADVQTTYRPNREADNVYNVFAQAEGDWGSAYVTYTPDFFFGQSQAKFGGSYNVTDKVTLRANNEWVELNGIVNGLISAEYSDGPLTVAALFAVRPQVREESFGARIEYGFDSGITLTARHLTRIEYEVFNVRHSAGASLGYEFDNGFEAIAAYDKDTRDGFYNENISLTLNYRFGGSSLVEDQITEHSNSLVRSNGNSFSF